jgi:hypothetical protein
MPLNTRTLGLPLAVPATMPESIFTCSEIIARSCVVATTTAAAMAMSANRFMCLCPLLCSVIGARTRQDILQRFRRTTNHGP